MNKKYFLIYLLSNILNLYCMSEEDPDRKNSLKNKTAQKNNQLLRNALANTMLTLANQNSPTAVIEIEPVTISEHTALHRAFFVPDDALSANKKIYTFSWPSNQFVIGLYKRIQNNHQYMQFIISSDLHLKKLTDNQGYLLIHDENPYKKEIERFIQDKEMTKFALILIGKKLDIEACQKTQEDLKNLPYPSTFYFFDSTAHVKSTLEMKIELHKNAISSLCWIDGLFTQIL